MKSEKLRTALQDNDSVNTNTSPMDPNNTKNIPGPEFLSSR